MKHRHYTKTAIISLLTHIWGCFDMKSLLNSQFKLIIFFIIAPFLF